MSVEADQGSGITVGELIRQLTGHPEHLPVCFGGGGTDGFTFYRVKNRGSVIQIEFNEARGNDYTMHINHENKE